jgi:hypothetical protein
VVAVIDVALTTTTPVAAVPPRLTVAFGRKPVPVMVTGVPPVVGPLVGKIVLTVGAGLVVPCPLARKAAICMTQLEVTGAVAL